MTADPPKRGRRSMADVPDDLGVSEQAMERAIVAGAKAADLAWGNPGRPEWADGLQADYARTVLEAALPVLLASGELVTGAEHEETLDHYGRLQDEAEEQRERAERAEREVRESDENWRAKWWKQVDRADRAEKGKAAFASAAVIQQERAETAERALRGVSNAYGCFAGCTASLPGGGADKHTPACREARACLAWLSEAGE